MRKLFGILALLLLLVFITSPKTAWSEPYRPDFEVAPNLTPVRFLSQPELPDPNNILHAVNKARYAAQQPPLRANPTLARLAWERAADMAIRQYFGHQNPSGQYYYDLLPKYGADPDYSCENLEMVASSDVQQIVNDWLASTKGHKACLLRSDAVEAGYAVSQLTTAHINGTTTTVYIVVAIHSTVL